MWSPKLLLLSCCCYHLVRCFLSCNQQDDVGPVAASTRRCRLRRAETTVEPPLALEKEQKTKQKKVVQQHREKVKTSFEESLFFISRSFPLCTIIKIPPHMSEFHMIGSGAAYQAEERYQIKALPSRQGSLPLTFQENTFFFLYPPHHHHHLRKRRHHLCLPCAAAAAATGCTRWQMSRRSNKSACSDFFHSRLAFITLTLSESPPEQQLVFC